MTILQPGGRAHASPTSLGRAASALGALDAFSFWVVPADHRSAGDLIVVGTTGGFLIRVCDRQGRFDLSGGIPAIDHRAIPGLRGVRSAAKGVRGTLGRASVFVDVEPVVCLTDAVGGAPVTAKDVRFVHVRDLAGDLSARPRILEQGRAQRGARALGVKLAGDHKRHFTMG